MLVINHKEIVQTSYNVQHLAFSMHCELFFVVKKTALCHPAELYTTENRPIVFSLSLSISLTLPPMLCNSALGAFYKEISITFHSRGKNETEKMI